MTDQDNQANLSMWDESVSDMAQNPYEYTRYKRANTIGVRNMETTFFFFFKRRDATYVDKLRGQRRLNNRENVQQIHHESSPLLEVTGCCCVRFSYKHVEDADGPRGSR